jgi:hypothetical protein
MFLSVLPCVNSIAVLFSIFPLSFIFLTVWPGYDTIAVLFVVFVPALEQFSFVFSTYDFILEEAFFFA